MQGEDSDAEQLEDVVHKSGSTHKAPALMQLMVFAVVSRQGSSDSLRAYVKHGAVKKCGLLTMKHVLSRTQDMKVLGCTLLIL